ncbi:MAG TPA: TauD/TfdA family dioxygenase [Alphaproteobacteria bacterium]|nr:TauD/TfdA family dioxygenase [Alphaproteobacteria bacterium]
MSSKPNPWKRSAGRREPAELMKPLVDPAGWTADEIRNSDGWMYRVSEAEIAEVFDAVAAVERSGRPIHAVAKADFRLPWFAAVLADLKAECLDGRGFAYIRGLPVEGRTRVQNVLAFWGLGLYMGRPISQNAKGHLLEHVKNAGGDINSPTGRGYNSPSALGFHADSCDMFGLMCLHIAKAGGQHRLVSSVTVYNEMLKRRPDLVQELAFRFYRTRRGEIPPGETVPWQRHPVFSVKDGYFSARGASSTIVRAQKLPGVPKLTPAQIEAIDVYQQMSGELSVEIDFEPGDVSFVLNHVALHARSRYEDWPEPERKRHLLRLWLDLDGGRPLNEEVKREISGIVGWDMAPKVPLDMTPVTA